MTVARAFQPSFDALAELVAFTAAGFEAEGIDRRLLIGVELCAIPGGVEGCLTAECVADFDVTRAPSQGTALPIEQRQPSELGLQLTRQMVDSIEYEYQDTQQRSRVTFRKTLA